MRWTVYADLERPLTKEEQRRVFDALDVIVPDSGCVGPSTSGRYEVYFEVSAASHGEAATTAARYVNAVLEQAQLQLTFVVEVTARK